MDMLTCFSSIPLPLYPASINLSPHFLPPTTYHLYHYTDKMNTYRHKYTRSNQIWGRCLEGLYMVILLQQGFGFSDTERRITIALEVRDHEVEWTLGFALSEINFNVVTDTIVGQRHRLQSLVTRLKETARYALFPYMCLQAPLFEMQL